MRHVVLWMEKQADLIVQINSEKFIEFNGLALTTVTPWNILVSAAMASEASTTGKECANRKFGPTAYSFKGYFWCQLLGPVMLYFYQTSRSLKYGSPFHALISNN